ncbi:MAG: Gfo/Idh/MocA family oxidoreductase [Candidatus Latescibacteria bacterium]|jgi:predicted dehydrogenase|nr:Gfo/Idh/MocA family oxidoreductase [Candidatus Latescibacterota bacterium]
MLRIGIVGAENSHTVQISKVLNIQKRVPGCRVVCVWGEAPRYAKDSAAQGQIPEIVKDPADMIGKVDAACVDHRHGMHHLPAARPLLEAKVPLFIDKPFCYRVKEGIEFLARAKRLKVPVCSFSTLPKQASFVEMQKELKKLGRIISIVSTGPCDIKSKYGGVSFYGIHQVDMLVRLLGNDVTHGQINLGKKNHTATLYSASGAISTMNLFTEGYTAFHLSVIAEKGRIDRVVTRDESPYLSGVKAFCRMFKTGKTDETPDSMLTPVAVLEALEKSIKQKRRVKVPAIS